MPESTKQYYAFISYKREDEAWAKWLQHKLEHYKLPSNLNGRSDLPKEIRPIFRDKSDLAGGVLAEEINNALENSKYLIVICSPRAAQSEWVGKEVQTFIEMGCTDKIIPFIVGGVAHSKDPQEECFPLALRNLPREQEILGVNINEMGRDAAAVKVVAHMFGLQFDELWQRHEREKKRKRNWIIAASVIGFLIMTGVALWMYAQRQQTQKANWKMMEYQSRVVAAQAQSLIDEGDSYTAQRLLLEVLPDDLENPNKPYIVEAEAALRKTVNNNTTILKGHKNNILDISFSPDGKRIVSSSNDSTIRIWNKDTGALMMVLRGYTDAYSPDGKVIASAEDDIIRLWDAETGDLLRIIDNKSHVYSVSYSPDGTRIVSTSDESLRVWDSKTCEIIMTLQEHTHNVYLAKYSSDGSKIISAGDSVVRIWDAYSGDVLKVLKNQDQVLSADISPNGDMIAMASIGFIKLFDVETGSTIRTIKTGNWNWETHISFDGKMLLSTSDFGDVNVFNIRTGKIINSWSRLGEGVRTACFSPDNKQVVMAHNNDNTIHIYYIEQDMASMVIPQYAEMAIFNHDGTHIAAAGYKSIDIYDAKTGELIKELKGHKSKLNAISYSSDGKYIASASERDSIIIIWNTMSGDIVKKLIGHSSSVKAISYSPDGKYLASASRDKTIIIWDVITGEIVNKLIDQIDWCDWHTSISFSPDGCFIASLLNDTIRIRDVKTGDIKNIIDTKKYCRCISYSPDGKCLVSAIDTTIVIFDVNNGQIIKKLKGHVGDVTSVAYSRDGQYIVSASWRHHYMGLLYNEDCSVRIWDANTGDEICKFNGHKNIVLSAFFSPDGRKIVSADNDGIRIWDFPLLQGLIDQTRERFKDRPLTTEERHQYYLE